VSAADGWGRAGSGRGEGSAGARAMGRLGHEGGECGRARERERGIGPETAQPRGVSFFLFSISYFLFLFLISISFISFSFEQIIS
jgi:hypothetical protein